MVDIVVGTRSSSRSSLPVTTWLDRGTSPAARARPDDAGVPTTVVGAPVKGVTAVELRDGTGSADVPNAALSVIGLAEHASAVATAGRVDSALPVA